MSKIPHIPVCVLCEPLPPASMVGYYLKLDGLCAIHAVEYDVDDLYRRWQEWKLEQDHEEFRSIIQQEYRLEVERYSRAAGIHWLRSAPEWITRGIAAKYKEFYGEDFNSPFDD